MSVLGKEKKVRPFSKNIRPFFHEASRNFNEASRNFSAAFWGIKSLLELYLKKESRKALFATLLLYHIKAGSIN